MAGNKSNRTPVKSVGKFAEKGAHPARGSLADQQIADTGDERQGQSALQRAMAKLASRYADAPTLGDSDDS